MTVQTIVITVKSDDSPAKLIERMAAKVNNWNRDADNYQVSTRTKDLNKLIVTVTYNPTVIRLPYHLIGGMTDEIMSWSCPEGYAVSVG